MVLEEVDCNFEQEDQKGHQGEDQKGHQGEVHHNIQEVTDYNFEEGGHWDPHHNSFRVAGHKPEHLHRIQRLGVLQMSAPLVQADSEEGKKKRGILALDKKTRPFLV